MQYCFEVEQGGDFSIQPPKKPKLQPSVNFDQKKLHLNTATQEDDSIDEEIEAEIKRFFFSYRDF